MRSVCAVSHPVIRVVLRVLLFPDHNQRVELRLCGQRVKQQHKQKLGLEQHFRAVDFLP